MFKSGVLNPYSWEIHCKCYGSQGQSLDQTQELQSEKYIVTPTDVIFQHHLIVSLENRLVELVSQMLCCLSRLSGMKNDWKLPPLFREGLYEM